MASITQVIYSTIIYLATMAALAWSQDSCRCALPGVGVSFRSCKIKPAEWKPHDHHDIGLTGSCIPQVPVK